MAMLTNYGHCYYHTLLLVYDKYLQLLPQICHDVKIALDLVLIPSVFYFD